jgi:hypothetical protein
MLLPALGKAKQQAHKAKCLGNDVCRPASHRPGCLPAAN